MSTRNRTECRLQCLVRSRNQKIVEKSVDLACPQLKKIDASFFLFYLLCNLSTCDFPSGFGAPASGNPYLRIFKFQIFNLESVTQPTAFALLFFLHPAYS